MRQDTPRQTPTRQTPLGRHPPGQTPPWADTPWADTPWTDTSPGRHPPGRHPWADTLWADTPPGIHPPQADTPLGRTLPLGRHPPGQTTPWADTPGQTLPLGRHPPADGYCSGRYASYWNAFLFESSSFIWNSWLSYFHLKEAYFIKKLNVLHICLNCRNQTACDLPGAQSVQTNAQSVTRYFMIILAAVGIIQEVGANGELKCIYFPYLTILQ